MIMAPDVKITSLSNHLKQKQIFLTSVFGALSLWEKNLFYIISNIHKSIHGIFENWGIVIYDLIP